jgi:hypothetical protein
MPVGANSIELLRYFRQPETAFGKSIQRDWQFWCFFIYNPFSNETKITNSLRQNLSSINKDFPPIIQPFHVINVTIPAYEFKREVMMYGQIPRSFPVLDFQGFEVQITLEEDEQGTVEYFINWLQRKIIDNEGYYNAPNKTKIPALVVEIQDKMGIPVLYYIFHDIFITHVDSIAYSYESNNPIRRNLTFACDRASTIFTKQNAVAAAIGAGVAAVNVSKNSTTEVVGVSQYLARKV